MCSVFCVLFLLVYVIFFLFVYKFTDNYHRVETQLINIISYQISCAISETSSVNSPRTPYKIPKTKNQYYFHGENLKLKCSLYLILKLYSEICLEIWILFRIGPMRPLIIVAFISKLISFIV
jgi:hypothetical protein